MESFVEVFGIFRGEKNSMFSFLCPKILVENFCNIDFGVYKYTVLTQLSDQRSVVFYRHQKVPLVSLFAVENVSLVAS